VIGVKGNDFDCKSSLETQLFTIGTCFIGRCKTVYMVQTRRARLDLAKGEGLECLGHSRQVLDYV